MEWVKCKERLPEKEGRFCVRLMNGCISTDYYSQVTGKENTGNHWKTFVVSAWMSLPGVYVPVRREQPGWKRICYMHEIGVLPDGYYFVTVRDLVFVADKCGDDLWTRLGRLPSDAVTAIMPIPAYLDEASTGQGNDI